MSEKENSNKKAQQQPVEEESGMVRFNKIMADLMEKGKTKGRPQNNRFLLRNFWRRQARSRPLQV